MYTIIDGYPVADVGRMPQQELRALVLDIVAGNFITSSMVPEDLVGSVFMPLFFGGMSPPEEVILEVMGPAPTEPSPPPAPILASEIPPVGDLPAQDVLPEELSQEILRAFKFGDISEEDFSMAQEELEKKNSELELSRKTVIQAHEKKVAAWEKKVRVQKRRNYEIKKKHAAMVALFEQEKEKFNRECDAYDERRTELFSKWNSNLGEIGEHVSKAGPRSINGYPMFFSMRAIHKDDWVRIRKAVEAELDRQKNLEV